MHVRLSDFSSCHNLRGCFRAEGQACERWGANLQIRARDSACCRQNYACVVHDPRPGAGSACVHASSLENLARRVFREHLRRQQRRLVERRRLMTMERHSKPRGLRLVRANHYWTSKASRQVGEAQRAPSASAKNNPVPVQSGVQAAWNWPQPRSDEFPQNPFIGPVVPRYFGNKSLRLWLCEAWENLKNDLSDFPSIFTISKPVAARVIVRDN